jgi:putative polyhydroxyalkanoic acid system protein
MPHFTVSIPHQLSRNDAKRHVDDFLTHFQQQYGNTLGRLESRWSGYTLDFTLTVIGMSLPGHLYVEDQVVRLEVAVPWPLAVLANSLKPRIEQEGRKLLGHG